MASEIISKGRVAAPLNITAPAPAIDLKGFQWDTVDAKIHGFQVEPVDDGSIQQPPVVDHPQHFSRVTDAQSTPGPAAPDPETMALRKQLAVQVGLDKPDQVVKAAKPEPLDLFPLDQFQGAYAGNGFNMIFRPRANGPDGLPVRPGSSTKPGESPGPDDNILELNITLEQMSFGEPLGDIPNRGLRTEPDIHLNGLPYLQTVQDVTNKDTGKGDHAQKTSIHFEPGVWLKVPPASFQDRKASVVRMASIPHGTTINAQGFAPTRNAKTVTGGAAGPPVIDEVDTTPFVIKDSSRRIVGVFKSMNENNQEDFRIPQNLKEFGANGSGKITTAIIKNPNLVLVNANQGLDITETTTFQVSTGPPDSAMNGGGTANISFLAGKQQNLTTADMPNPTAHAVSMTAKYWIERVMYKVLVPGGLAPRTKVDLRPTMPPDSTAPTPVFTITTGPAGNPTLKEITVPGIQIQTSQMVLLNFATLSWPHVSVSTVVPVDAQKFQMT